VLTQQGVLERAMIDPLYKVRTATLADYSAVTSVIAASYGKLLAGYYDTVLLHRALPLMAKANPVLLGSGTYYVAETELGEVIGCGGWSFEKPGMADVVPGTAHVRHFATDPNWVGRGVAKAILQRCVAVATGLSATTMEAYSTLAAVDFYRSLGFVAIRPIDVALAPGLLLPSLHMRRSLNE
jgi:GNAT superfamily N-acetyltransferase